MKKHQSKIITGLLILLLAAWMGRSFIQNLFPPKMKFYTEGLITIDNGRHTSLKDFKGNVVIVSCYQTWCTDCARETSILNELATKIHSNKFQVIYVSDEDVVKINSFRQRFLSDKILFTQYPGIMSSLGIHTFPTNFLLNKNLNLE